MVGNLIAYRPELDRVRCDSIPHKIGEAIDLKPANSALPLRPPVGIRHDLLDGTFCFVEQLGAQALTLLAEVAGGVLLAVALLASYLPARRAARINPVDALRSE